MLRYGTEGYSTSAMGGMDVDKSQQLSCCVGETVVSRGWGPHFFPTIDQIVNLIPLETTRAHSDQKIM
jgi:hypothetical protein